MECTEVAIVHPQHVDKCVEVAKFFFGMDFQQHFHIESMG